MLIYKRALLLCIIVTQAILGVAQQRDSTNQSDTLQFPELGEVVITATRTGTLKSRTPEAISSLALGTILKNQMRSAPEALIQTPGVFVQKTNHGGGSAFLRGLTGNQTLMLIDGIRLSNATMRYGPNQYFNTIDVFSLNRIEVLRGSGSVQYGSDAIGGTIQAFTPGLSFTDESRFGGNLTGRLATGGMEQSIHASTRYSSKNTAFRGGFTYRNFGDLIGGDTTGRQSPNGYRELDFDFKGKVLLAPRSELTFAFQRTHQDSVPVYHKIALENYAINHFVPQNRNLAYLRLNQQINKGIFKTLTTTGSYQQTTEGRISQKNGASTSRKETDQVHSSGFSSEITTAKGLWTANSGIEIYHDQVYSDRQDTNLDNGLTALKRGLYPDGATMTSFAAFSIHAMEFSNWTIHAGARLNYFVINIDDVNLGETRLTPSAMVGNVALLRKLNSSSTLFISLNSGFRAPNIDDLGTLGIVDFRYEVPNFNLKPEHSYQYQVGYKYQGSRLRGEIYLYRNELIDLIVRNPSEGDSIEGYPVYLKENTERAYLMGAETNWSYPIGRSWLVNGSLTYTYGQNITRSEPLRRVPPMFGSLSLAYQKKNGQVSIEWLAAAKQDRLAAGDRADNRIPLGGTPGWNILNLHASYTRGIFTINLTLQNLLNADYRYHGSGVNGYGRSGLVTLMIATGR
jgi:hemoglobin/transferrin/lactoferrin receptor protein